jgi:sec-independent protein translocase protein TatA
MPSLPIGPLELLLILAIALLVLGPGKLPEVGSAMGRTIREFRKASTDIQDATDLSPRTATTSPQAGATPHRVDSGAEDALDEDVPPRGTPADPKDAAS